MKNIYKYWVIAILLFVQGCTTLQQATYSQKIETTSQIDGIYVSASKSGDYGWKLYVRNNTDKTIKLVWDDSAYVSTSGSSSRLIRGSTRRIHVAQSQPASPIPPGAELNEYIISEATAQLVGTYVKPKPENINGKGRLYVVFDVGGTQKSWEAKIEYIEIRR